MKVGGRFKPSTNLFELTHLGVDFKLYNPATKIALVKRKSCMPNRNSITVLYDEIP